MSNINIDGWEFQNSLRTIVENNCKEIPYEGTEVDKHGIVEDITILLKNTLMKINPIENQGWDCPNSPTGYCDYQQEDGSFDEDSCIYCGEPDERK